MLEEYELVHDTDPHDSSPQAAQFVHRHSNTEPRSKCITPSTLDAANFWFYLFDVTYTQQLNTLLLFGKTPFHATICIRVEQVAYEWLFSGFNAACSDRDVLDAVTRFLLNFRNLVLIQPLSVVRKRILLTRDELHPASAEERCVCMRFMRPNSKQSWDAMKQSATDTNTNSNNGCVPAAQWKVIHQVHQSNEERFLLDFHIHGPCWMSIPYASAASDFHEQIDTSISVQRHYVLRNAKHLRMYSESHVLCEALNIAPTISTLTPRFNIATCKMHSDASTSSLLAISARRMHAPMAVDEQAQVLTLDSSTPVHFLNVQSFAPMQPNDTIQPCANAEAVYATFCAWLVKYDIDILMFGNMSADLEAVTDRCMLGRLNRRGTSTWTSVKSSVGGKHMDFFETRSHGRLFVDISVLANCFLTESYTYYTIEHLALTLLEDMTRTDQKHALLVIDSMNARTFTRTSEQVATLLDWSAWYTHTILRIDRYCMFLGLARNIASLCGCKWQKTLQGYPSARIESMFMHYFTSLGYICPDKAVFGAATAAAAAAADSVTTKRRYEGGLVLEPKRGLYNSIVLFLDFNSLYPSIIQEYGLCFTNEQHIPRIARLLRLRRSAIKEEMTRRPHASIQEKAQSKIGQLAVKLIANSMYGALGMESFRFAAVDIACKITTYGRSIMRTAIDDTATLLVDLGTQIVYGDTDSLALDTSTQDVNLARQIGENVARCINRRYRIICIDIDTVYTQLLLLQKKHYVGQEVRSPVLRLTGGNIIKRDVCAWIKSVYDEVLQIVFHRHLTMHWTQESTMCQHLLRFLKRAVADMHMHSVEDFVMVQCLNREPSSYTNASAECHVLIALRQHMKVGQHVPFVYCTKPFIDPSAPPTPVPARLKQAAYAYHPMELAQMSASERAETAIDYAYYRDTLYKALVKLLAHIAVFDLNSLAHLFGVAHQVKNASHTVAIKKDIQPTPLILDVFADHWLDPVVHTSLLMQIPECRYWLTDTSPFIPIQCIHCAQDHRFFSCVQRDMSSVFLVMSQTHPQQQQQQQQSFKNGLLCEHCNQCVHASTMNYMDWIDTHWMPRILANTDYSGIVLFGWYLYWQQMTSFNVIKHHIETLKSTNYALISDYRHTFTLTQQTFFTMLNKRIAALLDTFID